MTSGFTDMDSLITISVTDAWRIFVEMVTLDEGARILSSAGHALQMAEVSHEPPTQSIRLCRRAWVSWVGVELR